MAIYLNNRLVLNAQATFILNNTVFSDLPQEQGFLSYFRSLPEVIIS